jgi:hypothetical protein
MVDNITQEAKAAKINPKRHPNAASMIEDLNAAKGSSPSLTELDQWRQIVSRDVKGDPAEKFYGDKIINGIDDFIDTATPKDMSAGDPKTAAELILKARKANSIFRKTEVLHDALEAAKLQTSGAGSGGNIDNAIRQQIKSILKNPKRARFFSAEERAALRKVVAGDSIQNFARLVGKMSPEGNGLNTMLQTLGGVFSGGATVPISIAGFAAKRFADQATKNNLDDALRLIQSGQQP